MALSIGYLKTPSGVLKIVEILTVIVAFSMFRGSNAMFKPDDDANYFGGGVLVTALIITPLLTTCYIMGRFEIQKTIFEIVFNFLMFVFLLAAGVVTVEYYKDFTFNIDNYRTNSLVLGSFCIISSAAYLADTVCAVHLYRK